MDSIKKLGEYTVIKQLGKGGMGVVYLARQESLDRLVALKVIPESLTHDLDFVQRFQREARAAAKFVHPNVTQIYSVGEDQGVHYYAMEYVEGEDLSQRLRRVGKLPMEEAIRTVQGVASALAYAQELGIVHRDIKPSNFMIGKRSEVKVMDFGLAKGFADQSDLTQPGMVVGTVHYMSPEQGRGEPLDTRSDLYSLGVVLYELLTGRVPFKADTPSAGIYMHIHEPPLPPRELNPEIPEQLERIVLKTLAKRKEDRYASPAELISDLDRILHQSWDSATIEMRTPPQGFPSAANPDAARTTATPLPARTPQAGGPARPPKGPSRTIQWTAIAAIAVAAVGIGWWTYRLPKERAGLSKSNPAPHPGRQIGRISEEAKAASGDSVTSSPATPTSEAVSEDSSLPIDRPERPLVSTSPVAPPSPSSPTIPIPPTPVPRAVSHQMLSGLLPMGAPQGIAFQGWTPQREPVLLEPGTHKIVLERPFCQHGSITLQIGNRMELTDPIWPKPIDSLVKEEALRLLQANSSPQTASDFLNTLYASGEADRILQEVLRDHLLTEAERLWNLDRREEAINKLETAQAADLLNASGRARLAQWKEQEHKTRKARDSEIAAQSFERHLRAGSFEKAEKELALLRSADPETHRVKEGKLIKATAAWDAARAAHKLGRIEESMRELDLLRGYAPDFREANYLQETIWAQLRKPKEPEAPLSSASDPPPPPGPSPEEEKKSRIAEALQRARQRMAQGTWDEALAACEAVLSLERNHPEAQQAREQILAYRQVQEFSGTPLPSQKQEEALQACIKVLEFDSKHRPARLLKTEIEIRRRLAGLERALSERNEQAFRLFWESDHSQAPQRQPSFFTHPDLETASCNFEELSIQILPEDPSRAETSFRWKLVLRIPSVEHTLAHAPRLKLHWQQTQDRWFIQKVEPL
jgi:serine/threonine protein kinase